MSLFDFFVARVTLHRWPLVNRKEQATVSQIPILYSDHLKPGADGAAANAKHLLPLHSRKRIKAVMAQFEA